MTIDVSTAALTDAFFRHLQTLSQDEVNVLAVRFMKSLDTNHVDQCEVVRGMIAYGAKR